MIIEKNRRRQERKESGIYSFFRSIGPGADTRPLQNGGSNSSSEITNPGMVDITYEDVVSFVTIEGTRR